MSKFEVPIVRIFSVEDHPNADKLSVCRVEGTDFVCVSAKLDDGSHRHQAGDRVVYVPEGAVVPESILRRFGFWDEEKGKGVLAGSKGDRVKAIKLRGVLSQGLLIRPKEEVDVDWYDDFEDAPRGSDLSAVLGIVKYEPPIPVSMAGDVFVPDFPMLKFDVESIQKFPDVLEVGEEVVATEKIHGTCCIVVFDPRGVGSPETPDGIAVSSKGLAEKGLALKLSNRGNLYVRALVESGLYESIRARKPSRRFALVGEVFGDVQDLKYGMKSGKFDFRLFAVHYVDDESMNLSARGPKWATHDVVSVVAEVYGLKTVPVVYRGPYEGVDRLRSVIPSRTFVGDGECICEGVVVTPVRMRSDDRVGPVRLKLVSEAYLTRKSGTEYN